MSINSIKILVVMIFLSFSLSMSAQVIFVQNENQLKSAVNSASPGDTIVVKEGNFDTDGSVTIRNNGTAEAPIVIMAETMNGTNLVNESYFDFRKCSYITISGFTFSSTDVTAVKLQASHHIRITNNIFRINETESVKWILVGGIWDDPNALSHDNKIDHNIFENKTQPGNFITIDGTPDPTYISSQRDTIEYNYFRNNNPRAENEKESIRVGWSELSASSGNTVIQYNLFEDCNGDPEVISVKTCDNIVRYNTFIRCQGTVCLRHGNRSVVHGNFFLGEEVTGTGGIRLYGDDHLIFNNYFEGLTGTTWDAPLTLTNGDYDGGTNYSKHWRIKRAKIVFNTLVNNTNGIEIGYSNNGKYSKPPQDVVISNNIISGNKNDLVKIISTPASMTWQNNIMFATGTASLGTNFSQEEAKLVDPLLVWEENIYRISDVSPAIDSASGEWSYVVDDMDGQLRDGTPDIGADEFSTLEIVNKLLTPEDVGPVEKKPTSFSENSGVASKSFLLRGNYPNPFNNSTKIAFVLNQTSNVTVKIYNILGKKIATLLEKKLTNGEYVVTWNASGESSGIYFVKVLADEKFYTHRLIYLK